jgi:poly(3-hydroxybutyrate) depolymerase
VDYAGATNHRLDVQAVPELSGLRSLQLSSLRRCFFSTELQALTGLKQLTQLLVDPINRQQLQYLPRQVQQLHLTVIVNHGCLVRESAEEVKQLADWLQGNISTVRSI